MTTKHNVLSRRATLAGGLASVALTGLALPARAALFDIVL